MALVALSALPASTTIVTTDILPAVIGGTTKKITAGNLRAQLFAFAATDPLNCGILTAVGNSTVTGTLSGITTLTAATGSFTTGSVGAGGLTVSGAAGLQALTATTGVFSAGLFTNGGSINFGNFVGTGKIIGASVGLSLRNTNDNADNITVTDAGLVTLRLNLAFAAASAKIIPGATQISFRDAADVNDNLVISNAGVVSVRGGLSVGGSLSFSSAVAKLLLGATSFAIRDNADTTNLMLFNTSGITLAQSLITTASVAGSAGLNVPHGSAPTSPVNGDLWSTTTTLNFRLNGVTKSITMT